MNVFCLKCKSHTESENEEEVYTSNGCRNLKCFCAICGVEKRRFLKKILGGDIVDMIGSTIGELHLPGSNFTGPGTKLGERLSRGDKPTDRVDEAALFHDVAYYIHKDKKKRHEADRKLLKDIDEIESPTVKERVKRAVTKAVIKPKLFLGLGLDEAEYSKDSTKFHEDQKYLKKNF